jgi:glycosyltransferase involved in cell wall biosynthesis
MASGIPVVASRVGAIPETVEHGVDGLLFPPGNVEAMVRMLKDVLVQSNYAKLLSDNGYRKVTQGYTIEQMVKRVVDIFDAHLGGK